MQQCSQLVYFPEGENHPQHQNPEQKQPEQRKSIGTRIEEDRTPEEIDDQLCNEQIHAAAALGGSRCQADSGGTDTHQRIEKGPHDGKYNSRW